MSETDSKSERRRAERKDNRTEMLMGASRTVVSNLSPTGAFVAILAGLQPGDAFSFELALDGDGGVPVKGKAHVKWTDPGVGVGVEFDLSPADRERVEAYLAQLEESEGVETVIPDEEYDPPRGSSRRTIAVGSQDPDGFTKVWFRYLPPDETS